MRCVRSGCTAVASANSNLCAEHRSAFIRFAASGTPSTRYEQVKMFAVGSLGIFVLTLTGAVIRTDHLLNKSVISTSQDTHAALKQLKQATEEAGKVAATANHSLVRLDVILQKSQDIDDQERQLFSNAQGLLADSRTAVTGLTATEATVNQSLNQTTGTVNASLDTTTRNLNQSLAGITEKLDQNLDQSRQTLATVNQATGDLDSVLKSPELQKTMASAPVIAENVQGISAHVDGITADFEHKTHQMMHPSKVRRVFTIFEDLLNMTAHSVQIEYYLNR